MKAGRGTDASVSTSPLGLAPWRSAVRIFAMD